MIIKFCYISLIIGFFFKTFLFLLSFKESVKKYEERFNPLLSILLCILLFVFDIFITIISGLIGIEIFLK